MEVNRSVVFATVKTKDGNKKDYNICIEGTYNTSERFRDALEAEINNAFPGGTLLSYKVKFTTLNNLKEVNEKIEITKEEKTIDPSNKIYIEASYKDIVELLNKSWDDTVKLLDSEENYIGSITYDKVLAGGGFLIFRDVNNNKVAIIAIKRVVTYLNNNSLILK